MTVISHRGYWKEVINQNTIRAFKQSFDIGFGVETDLRDCNGKIVISHDIPIGNEITFEEVLQTMNGRNLLLALNIKSDGLCIEIKKLLCKYNHTNYFTFDMSIPDMILHLNNDLKVFTGLSDILTTPVMSNKAKGIWLDSFNTNWYNSKTIDDLIESDKSVCIVSAELHKRDKAPQWKIIKQSKNIESNNLMICTDIPEEAFKYFNG